MAQLSRMSLLVPVFTALKKRVASTLSKPKVRVRALLSARMSVTMKLASGLNTRVPAGDGAGFARSRAGLATPPLASARYALVSDSSVTSALPSARLKP